MGIKKRNEDNFLKKPSSSAFVVMEASQPTGPLSGCSEAAVFIFSSTFTQKENWKTAAVVCTEKTVGNKKEREMSLF